MRKCTELLGLYSVFGAIGVILSMFTRWNENHAYKNIEKKL